MLVVVADSTGQVGLHSAARTSKTPQIPTPREPATATAASVSQALMGLRLVGGMCLA